MASTLEEILILVWRQTLIENGNAVVINGHKFRVRRTSYSQLREVDFEFEGQALRGLEQNPATSSRWGQLAREGKKVMQFLRRGKYIANVVDGKANIYQHGK